MARVPIQQVDPSEWVNLRGDLLNRPAILIVPDNVQEAQDVASDLLDTMKSQPLAVGLSANQIGSPLSVAVMRVDSGELVMFNPRILGTSGKKDRKRESCMSVWGKTGEVERRDKVRLQFETVNLETEELELRGFAGRVAQHEVDHLNGLVYTRLVRGGVSHTELFAGHSPVPAEEQEDSMGV